MKKTTYAILSLFLVLLLCFLPACSKSENDGAYVEENYLSQLQSSTIKNESSDFTADSTGAVTETASDDGRKIIQNVDLAIQTKEFDSLLEKIQKQISVCGGYIQDSTTNGREIDSDRNRSARMTLRIPADKSEEFDAFLSENSVVISKSVSTEDVTLDYVDMESRVSALEIEKSALEELLKNAASVEEVISIREKLTDVIYEIESYKSKLRTYDNLVEYCTVSIYISEVERTAVVEDQSVWQEIGTNLKNNFESVWDGLVALFILLVSAIPFLIPILLFVLIVLVIVKNTKKKKKSNHSSPSEENNK